MSCSVWDGYNGSEGRPLCTLCAGGYVGAVAPSAGALAPSA